MLYFGSFNPVHTGHMAIAEYVLRGDFADELWFVVSPHNPLKPAGMLMDEEERLIMVRLAIQGSELCRRMKVCDIEFDMPRPSYTIDTLEALERLFPGVRFSLLIGGDITGEFHKWKDWRKLLERYPVYVYPRPGYDSGRLPEECGEKFIFLTGAPQFGFSSTEIREALRSGLNVNGMIPGRVYDHIKTHNLWNTK